MSLSLSGTIHSWALERFAKYITTQGSEETTETSNQGHWKQFSSEGGASSIQISLLESNNIVVSDSKVIHESFSLFTANKWLKAVVKGDSMLFLYRMNNDTRRFRIKFSKSSDRSAFENCSQFVSKIKSHVPVEEIPAGSTESDSQIQTDDSQQTADANQQVCKPSLRASGKMSTPVMTASSSGLSLSDLATKCMSSEKNRSSPQTSEHISPPQDRLSLMIRLCLTDANFPAFVEAVENELLNLTS